MEDFIAKNPAVAASVILALGWVIGQMFKVAIPALWKRADNSGMVTLEAQEACQKQLAERLAKLEKALNEGDGVFARLLEGQRLMSLTLRDMCHALDSLISGDVDCAALRRLIVGEGEPSGTRR